jgi:hypothetical protein
MITVEQYAKKRKISVRTARKQLDRKVDKGEMERQKGPNNSYVYYTPTYQNFRWHDPFNKTLKVARSIQEDAGEGTEIVAESGHISNPKEVASHA